MISELVKELGFGREAKELFLLKVNIIYQHFHIQTKGEING